MNFLATELLARTQSGSATWVSLGDGDTFACQGTASSVLIRSRDRDASPPFILELYDASAAIVDTLESEWDEPIDVGRQAAPWNETLTHLYMAARRKATGVDDLIGSLLDDIDHARDGTAPIPEPTPKQLPNQASPPGSDLSDIDELPF
jgi:hypothetical protein